MIFTIISKYFGGREDMEYIKFGSIFKIQLFFDVFIENILTQQYILQTFETIQHTFRINCVSELLFDSSMFSAEHI